MATATWMQTNFNGGEWSPFMYGHADFAKYKNGLSDCTNFVPVPQGPVTRRPGTRYVAATKSGSTRTCRLQRFEFSVTQAYVIEFGNLYARFYTNGGQLLSGGSPYEVVTPYTEADLPNLYFAQSADVLYIAHPSYPPATLSRQGATSWTYAAITFTDGPYLTTNYTTTTATASGTAGSVTVTFSSVTGVNGGAGFTSADIGRFLRIKSLAVWQWGIITAVGSTTSVTWSIQPPPNNQTGTPTAAATTFWRLGEYCSANGYPAVVTFHEDRLVFGGSTAFPQRIDASNTSDYLNFMPTNYDGTIVASNAYSFSLNSSDVNALRWISSDEKGILAGTSGNEWVIRADSSSAAISPLNAKAVLSTGFGSAAVQPIRVGKKTLYVQRTARKLRELEYQFGNDGFVSSDISILAEHMTQSGLKQIAVQRVPWSVLWAVRTDGVLVGITYDRDQDVIGWHKHTLGGTGVSVESVASIPSVSGAYDDVWLVVKRTVNGATFRSVELMSKFWEHTDSVTDACYTDCGSTYSGAATTTVSGLTWLIGETVGVLADGANHPDCVVSGAGVITLNRSATKVQVGLKYTSSLTTLRIESGGEDGPAQGKIKRIHRIIVRLFDTVGLTLTAMNGQSVEESFRSSANAMNTAIAPFTGDKVYAWPGGHEREGQLTLSQTMPLPCNILSVSAQLQTQDAR